MNSWLQGTGGLEAVLYSIEVLDADLVADIQSSVSESADRAEYLTLE